MIAVPPALTVSLEKHHILSNIKNKCMKTDFASKSPPHTSSIQTFQHASLDSYIIDQPSCSQFKALKT